MKTMAKKQGFEPQPVLITTAYNYNLGQLDSPPSKINDASLCKMVPIKKIIVLSKGKNYH